MQIACTLQAFSLRRITFLSKPPGHGQDNGGHHTEMSGMLYASKMTAAKTVVG